MGGFVVPLVLPLICISFASQLAVFHLALQEHSAEVKYETKPAASYLFVSVCLGSALSMWFYIDNAEQIEGEYLVCIGVPMGALMGPVLAATWLKRQAEQQHARIEMAALMPPSLHEALLGSQDLQMPNGES